MKAVYPMGDSYLLTGPGMEDLPVKEMHTADGDRVLVSCWQPSWKERIQILFGRPFFLAVLTPWRHPGVLLTTDPNKEGLS